MRNVTASHLADPALFDFAALGRTEPGSGLPSGATDLEPWDER
jgi:hypothetical protein